MFSAVSNLGAGGTQSLSLSDTSNAVLYAMFSLTGLISGGINNCERELICPFYYLLTVMHLNSAWSSPDAFLGYPWLCSLRRRSLVVRTYLALAIWPDLDHIAVIRRKGLPGSSSLRVLSSV